MTKTSAQSSAFQKSKLKIGTTKTKVYEKDAFFFQACMPTLLNMTNICDNNIIPTPLQSR